MKILVAVKRVPDPNARLTLTPEGQLNLSGVRHVVNPWDEIALDLAVETKARGEVSEIVAVMVGPEEAEETLRAALARGADRGILIVDDAPNPQIAALSLAVAVFSEQPGLILCGKRASDSDDGQTGPRLAGMMKIPVLVGGTEINLREMKGKVVCVDMGGRDPKLIPLSAICNARSKAMEKIPTEPGDPSPKDAIILGYSLPPSRQPCRMVRDIGELTDALQGGDGVQQVTEALGLPVQRSATLWLGTEDEAAALGTVAGKRGWPLVNGVLSVEAKDGRLHCRRYVHSGRFIEEVAISAEQNAILIVPDAVRSDNDRERVARLIAQEACPVTYADDNPEVQANLKTARVVVAGGRGLRDAGTFDRLVGGLAETLGGAVAASGGASNTGIAPAHLVIGQSGTYVAPDLYVALGISGMDQHVAGFKDAKTVVAINSDPDAPIFRFADIGLVADVNTAVPEWIARVRK